MRKAIAIDFDGCLCANAWPEVGAPNWEVIHRALYEQENGAGLILWTCREGKLLEDAVAACAGWGLRFDAVNESLPDWIEAYGTQPRKVGASEYWDDKAIRLPELVYTQEERARIDYIKGRLSYSDRLCQLAEEACELSQAALKLKRAMEGTNPTPVTEEQAKTAMLEEFGDVLGCLDVLLTPSESGVAVSIRNAKFERWSQRLKQAE